MRDLTPAIRFVEINSPGCGKHSGGHKIIHRLFSFHLRGLRRGQIIVSGRCHFLVVAVLLDSRPASSTAEARISQLLCRRRDGGDSAHDRYRLRYTRTHTHIYYIYIYMHIFVYLRICTSSLRADGMRPHACARIEARLSRDVSRGGFPWYPSWTSNLFVCIGMSLCRLIHARRPCRERHVGCSAAPTRSCECTCIFYWRYRAGGFPIAQTRHTRRESIRDLPRASLSRFDVIYVTCN